jgi:hypothetical protein
MRLLPMGPPTIRREGEPVISLVCGVPAVSIGIGALFVCLFAGPPGAHRFFNTQDFSIVERDTWGLVMYQKPSSATLPSTELLGMLSAGFGSAALGIYLSRRQRPQCRVTTCKAGMIVCSIIFFLLWTMIVIAAIP